jgi:hypothetical protein
MMIKYARNKRAIPGMNPLARELRRTGKAWDKTLQITGKSGRVAKIIRV